LDRHLIDYLPPILRGVREYIYLFTTEQNEIETLWNAVDDAFSDQFIADATVNGVKRWEKILGIKPKVTDRLEDRKFRILARLSEQLPFTLKTLEQQLISLCGEGNFKIEVDNQNYLVIVRLALTSQEVLNNLAALLNRIVPANMVIDLKFKYNKHSMFTDKAYSHYQLRSYTHNQLRNEVNTFGRQNFQLLFDQTISRRFL